MNVAKVENLKIAINALSHDEFLYLWEWLNEKEWSHWDSQIESDSVAGKLDFLIEEAFTEKSQNKLGTL